MKKILAVLIFVVFIAMGCEPAIRRGSGASGVKNQNIVRGKPEIIARGSGDDSHVTLRSPKNWLSGKKFKIHREPVYGSGVSIYTLLSRELLKYGADVRGDKRKGVKLVIYLSASNSDSNKKINLSVWDIEEDQEAASGEGDIPDEGYYSYNNGLNNYSYPGKKSRAQYADEAWEKAIMKAVHDLAVNNR